MSTKKILYVLLIMPIFLTGSVSASEETCTDYIMTPGYNISLDKIINANLFIPISVNTIKSGTYSITDGQIRNHILNLGQGYKQLIFDVDWQNSDNVLRLNIDSPSVSFGSFYDEDDGRIDGRICIAISRSSGGRLPSGNWENTITGESVTATDYYSYSIFG